MCDVIANREGDLRNSGGKRNMCGVVVRLSQCFGGSSSGSLVRNDRSHERPCNRLPQISGPSQDVSGRMLPAMTACATVCLFSGVVCQMSRAKRRCDQALVRPFGVFEGSPAGCIVQIAWLVDRSCNRLPFSRGRHQDASCKTAGRSTSCATVCSFSVVVWRIPTVN